MGLAWFAGAWAERHEIESRTAALQSALRMQVAALRGLAGQYVALPPVVAHQPEVRALLAAPQDAALRGRVNGYFEDVARRTGAAAIYVMDVHGTTLAASNWRTPESFIDQNYSQRPYFTLARNGGTGLFYGVGMTTGKPGLFIAEPIAEASRDGERVDGVVAVKVTFDSLAASWAGAPEPLLLRDAHGIGFLSSYGEWLYHLTRPLAPDEDVWLRSSEAYGHGMHAAALQWSREIELRTGAYRVRTQVAGQSRRYLALDERLPEYGWTMTVMTDWSEVLQARNQARAIAALSTALLLLAGLYWRLRERRFAEQRQTRQELERRVDDRTRELSQAHAFRHAMGESLVVGMRARDLEGRIIYVNRALCRMTGYAPDELLGQRPPYPYWHPDDLDKHWEDSNASLDGRAAPDGFESRIRHKDGHDVVTRVYTAPLIEADGVQRGWMSSVIDITDQKRSEERQRAQEAQLQRAVRLAGLGEMASTLAHELNQPLMALSNFATAARALAPQGRSQTQAEELLASSLAGVEQQALRASEIVKRIRSMVRSGRGVSEEFSAADLLATVLDWLRPEIAARQARVEHAPLDALPPLCADRVLAEQLLLNLLLNALQALEGQPRERRRIDVTAGLDAGRMAWTIADHGPGIAATHAEQLFSPFFTTKATGLGLGLKVCRSIVESHGGVLEWRERAGGGAVFTFSLPLARPAP